MRCYAANALSVAMLIAAHNLVTTDNFLRALEGINTAKSPRRRRSRREEQLKLANVRPQQDGRARAA
jgi:hypothetical protein